MEEPVLYIDKSKKMPQFDLPIDFMVYDNIQADLLKYYSDFPCKIDASFFCLVTKGWLKATINLWDYTVTENNMVVILPGTFIQIKEVSDDIRVCFEGFSAKILEKINFWNEIAPLLLNIYKNPLFKINAKLGKIYDDFFSVMTQASTLEHIFSTPTIAHASLSLFANSLYNALENHLIDGQPKHTTREQRIVSEFLQLAFQNYREEHKIAFYAREINLTLSHFCNVISKATGLTAQEIVMNMIIMDAKTQLKATSATVAHIASSLGFNTPTTFNRYFKNYTGMTPQEYRNS